MSEHAEDSEHVAAEDLREFAYRALLAAGMPVADATDTADAMMWSDLRGLEQHGVSGKLPQCVRRIRNGGTQADARPRAIREAAASVAIDGRDSWGQVGASAAMRVAIGKALRCGAGVVSLRDTSSAAALGYYADLATREHLIGIVVTNGPALIPAWGGTTKQLGNQAHAIGVPAGRHSPILFDSALTVLSTGQMELIRERGEQLPDGVLLDARGEPTRDPAAWTAGLLVPIGGHRGYALALMFEILTGVLAGGARQGSTIGHPFDYGTSQGVGMICIAIDPRMSLSYDKFTARVDRLIDQIHASPPAPGVDRVLVPGERGYRTARERSRAGVPLTKERAETLRALAGELAIAAW